MPVIRSAAQKRLLGHTPRPRRSCRSLGHQAMPRWRPAPRFRCRRFREARHPPAGPGPRSGRAVGVTLGPPSDHGRARLQGAAAQVGGRTHLRLDDPLASAGPRLRAADRRLRSHHLHRSRKPVTSHLTRFQTGSALISSSVHERHACHTVRLTRRRQ